MEASAKLKWGLVCSISNKEQMAEFVDFAAWMIKQLEQSAAELHLGHRFAPRITFAFHAIPGSLDSAKDCYNKIMDIYPEVSYVIHILPGKDSMEYQVLKEVTMTGTLIGQGVLAENALAHFNTYKLEEVMANMNQWISRRLSQIMERQCKATAVKQEENKEVRARSTIPRTNRSPILPTYKVKAPYKPFNNRRKDQYQLLITHKPIDDTKGGTSFFNESAPIFRQPLRQIDTSNPNDFAYPVELALQSTYENTYGIAAYNPLYSFRPSSVASDSSTNINALVQKQVEDAKEREKECIVGGYPMSFNKYQIASLFNDFRPLNVQYIGAGEAMVKFANNFHAAQVIKKYNELEFVHEEFRLKVRSAVQEDPAKQVEATNAKLSRLLLKTTMEKAAGKNDEENTEQDKNKQDGKKPAQTKNESVINKNKFRIPAGPIDQNAAK